MDRVRLRTESREVKGEIYKYRASGWKDFLQNIQCNHSKSDKAFWKHLSKIYRPQSLPFTELAVGSKVTTSNSNITNELYNYSL